MSDGGSDLQELYTKFDGSDAAANARLAWYGQERAKGRTHEEAILGTYNRFSFWCSEVWPKRNIQLPKGVS